MGQAGRVAGLSRLTWACLLALGVGVAQFSSGFDGYGTDLWTYALIMERVAVGDPVLELDIFWGEPPPSPQVTALWILMGWLRRWTGLASPDLIRLLAAAAAALLSLGVWALAGRLWEDKRARLAAVAVFWLGLAEPWAIALGRNLCLGFVFLGTAEALRAPLRPFRIALCVALAFYVHPFGGVLAIAAVAVAQLARWRSGRAPDLRQLAWALLLGLLLVAPGLGRAAGFGLLPKSTAHLAPQGQLIWLGLRWLNPTRLLQTVPPALAVLAGVGLLWTPKAGPTLACRVARVGTSIAFLILLTPIYHLAVDSLGGWMVLRFAALSFPWVAATAALVQLSRGSIRSRALAYAGVLALALGASLNLAESLGDRPWLPLERARERPARHKYYAFSRPAQQEAFALRGILKSRAFVAADSLGYALAAGSLGRPISVPPASASPFGDSVSRKRWVDRAMWVGSGECWSALLKLFPDLEFLVTPAPGAEGEAAIWQRRFPYDPRRVQKRLHELGALRPAFRGRYFEVDALVDPIPGDDEVPPTVRFRKGRLCP